MAWIARLAARRVVWIIVGLVVYGLLNVAGIRAADVSGAVVPGAYAVPTDWEPVAVGYGWTATEGGQYSGSLEISAVYEGASPLFVAWMCPTGPYGALGQFGAGQTVATWAGQTGPTVGEICTLGVYTEGDAAFTLTVVGGALDLAPTPTPTPAPTATPTPAPAVQVVALVAEDRTRLDDLTAITTAGAALGVFLLTAVLVVTGLRR